MKSNRTREKILNASLELFNEKKASNVSTVQISAYMKISPGNLYYYYANKEELIRCIWKERMLDEIEALLNILENTNTVVDLLEFMEGCFKHYAKYKFFYTEISTLFVNDRSMMKIFEETAKKEIRILVEFFDRWIKDGKMTEMTDVQMLTLADNYVIISYAATSYCDLAGDSSSDGMEEFIRAAWFHTIVTLNQFLTEKTARELAEESKRRGYDAEEYARKRKLMM